MKTITEFTASMLRAAAQVQRSRPAAEDTTLPAEPAPAPAAQELDAQAPDAAQPAASATAGAYATAVGAAVGITGDRLARLLDALEVVGGRVDDLRMIRVLAGEDPPPSAKKRGEFYFVVEQMPRTGGRGRDDRRGGRAGHGGDHGRGGDRGGGGDRGAHGRGAREGFAGAREREPRSSEVPPGGGGWMLTRAPGDANEDRRGPRGPRRGDRPRGPGGRGPRAPGGGPPGRPGGAPRPGGPGRPGGAPRGGGPRSPGGK